MDFILSLPKLEKKNVVMVVIDILTKYAQFCSLSHTFKEIAIVATLWKQFKSYIETQRLLKVIEIQFSLVIFGLNYFIFWAPNSLTPHLAILNMMCKIRL